MTGDGGPQSLLIILVKLIKINYVNIQEKSVYILIE